MSAHPQPQLNPENNLNETFNTSYFKYNSGYATLADLTNYGNLFEPNNWSAINTFAAINATKINGISSDAFAYITYIPNIITEMTDISYDDSLQTTTIKHNTDFTNTGIDNNLNVGENINSDCIVNTSLINQSIITNQLSCKQLTINNKVFHETICYIYINGLTMPVMKSTLIESFNIKTITSLYVTIKSGYRMDVVDINGIVLYSITNDTINYMYYINVPYNTNMIKLNLYNDMNIIIS